MSDPQNRQRIGVASRWLLTSWKALVAFAGGIAVILGLIFHPPWASSSPAENVQGVTTQTCPGVSKGRISNVQADQSIPLGAYWKLNPGSQTPVNKQRLRALGRVVHFRVDINGYRGRQLAVWWWMLTARGEAVPEATLQHQLAFTLTPHDCSTGGTRDIWVELPKRRGRYQIEVQLLDPSGEKLDYGRTRPFAVLSSPA